MTSQEARDQPDPLAAREEQGHLARQATRVQLAYLEKKEALAPLALVAYRVKWVHEAYREASVQQVRVTSNTVIQTTATVNISDKQV